MTGGAQAREAKVSDWIGVDEVGRIILRTGKVELGQGAVTAIVQMGCHELGVPMAAVRCVSGDTRRGPDEWYTAGSVSVEQGGLAMRRACAQALGLAQRIQAPSLAEALRRSNLDVPVDPAQPLRVGPGLIGLSMPRLDLAAKLRGGGFIHDVQLPGMLAGRVLRAPNPQARLLDIDRAAMLALPNVLQVVVDGSFVGFVAESEALAWAAFEPAQALCRWDVPAAYPEATSVAALFAGLPVDTRSVGSTATPTGAVLQAGQLKATYTKPAIAHASIGPSCAVATCGEGEVEVLSHTQGVFALRNALARVLGLPPDSVVVRHVAGAGCYGHNGADDATLDACLLARAVPGRPVKVTWSRADELAASPMGSPMQVRISARLAQGRIADWQLEVWSGLHAARPGWGGAVNLLAATQLAVSFPWPLAQDVPPAMGGGGDRNAVALYDIPNQDVRYHFVPGMPLRTSSLRALGSYANLFAIESFVDELAVEAGIDALQFRIDHLADERAREVLRRVARAAGWTGGQGPRDNVHQGLAFGRYKNKAAYIAVVAQVVIEDDFRVDALWACVDAGQVINPDGLRHQIEGGLIQSLSWTLLEQMRFSTTHVESNSWEHYPILPIADTPSVQVELIDRPEMPPLGVGEVAQGPLAAAVANALAHGLGVRLRHLPLNRDAILAALS